MSVVPTCEPPIWCVGVWYIAFVSLVMLGMAVWALHVASRREMQARWWRDEAHRVRETRRDNAH